MYEMHARRRRRQFTWETRHGRGYLNDRRPNSRRPLLGRLLRAVGQVQYPGHKLRDVRVALQVLHDEAVPQQLLVVGPRRVLLLQADGDVVLELRREGARRQAWRIILDHLETKGGKSSSTF